jgi:hypothetical protein
MKWYNYLSSLFAGFFLANAVPHFVQGICGNFFPTPFANPPGVGLSSPTVNVLWGLLNLVAGYWLYRAGKISNRKIVTIIIFFLGIAICGIMLSFSFAHKMAQ